MNEETGEGMFCPFKNEFIKCSKACALYVSGDYFSGCSFRIIAFELDGISNK